MQQNPLLQLEALGQSIWLDYIRRGSITSGELKRWIDEDGVSGVTSNPTIFEKAIGGSQDYDDAIFALAREGKNASEIFRAVSVEDIQHAADLFRPTYDRTHGDDGFVSLEVSPGLAHDTNGTIAEARALWQAVNRPNVMIKVPATREGVPAIQQLVSEGLNINITLLFGLPRYQQVADAYVTGLEILAAKGKPIDRSASVASFFLSRIDVLIDPQLEKIMQEGGKQAVIARRLRGQVAIASAKVAYEMYQSTFNSEQFKRLADKGARTQRLLWASTSTKNPDYSDVKYVEPLIGPDTVNTVPIETLNAYRDHGHPQTTLDKDVNQAHQVLDSLPEVGIQIDNVTQQLEDEGVQKFVKAFDQLMQAIEEKRQVAMGRPIDRQVFHPGSHQA